MKLISYILLLPRFRIRETRLPFPPYIFMSYCLIKHKDKFIFYFTLLMHNNIPWTIYSNGLFQGNNMFQHFKHVVRLQPRCVVDTRLPAGLNLRLTCLNSPVADLRSVYGILGYFHMFGTWSVSFITWAVRELVDLHVSQLLTSEAGHAMLVWSLLTRGIKNSKQRWKSSHLQINECLTIQKKYFATFVLLSRILRVLLDISLVVTCMKLRHDGAKRSPFVISKCTDFQTQAW
jgi:hypothetical protein